MTRSSWMYAGIAAMTLLAACLFGPAAALAADYPLNWAVAIDPNYSDCTGMQADAKYYGENAQHHQVSSIWIADSRRNVDDWAYIEVGQTLNYSTTVNRIPTKNFVAWQDGTNTSAQVVWTYGNVQSNPLVNGTTRYFVYRHATDTDFWYFGRDGIIWNNLGGTPGLCIYNMDTSGWVESRMERNSESYDDGKTHFKSLQRRLSSPLSWALWDRKYEVDKGSTSANFVSVYEWYSVAP